MQAAFALRAAGFETVMVNSNPETVSTDYDTSDVLFFEPLTAEHVLDLIERVGAEGRDRAVRRPDAAQPRARARAGRRADHRHRARVASTSPADRGRFKALLEQCGLLQPAERHGDERRPRRSRSPTASATRCSCGPSLRARRPRDGDRLRRRVAHAVHRRAAVEASPDKPILVDKFLEDAIEVDVDAVADGTRCVIGGVMEHIEEAGIHTGDSCCTLPACSLAERGRRTSSARARGGSPRRSTCAA